MSDRGSHFLNETIASLLEEFQVYHQKSTLYHPQVNGIVEAFNKILENASMNIFNAKINDWHVRIPVVLWVYRTTCKKVTRQTPFRLIYGEEAMIPIEYIMPSLSITAVIDMDDRDTMEEHLACS